MNFELTTLGHYVKIQGGYAYKSHDFLDESNNKVLKIKNIRAGYVTYDDCAYISDELASKTKAWSVSEGDVLISMTGSGPNAPQSLVGRVARVWNGDAYLNQRVGRVVLKSNFSIHLDFIYYYLSQNSTQEYFVANSTGSANQANISGKTIEDLPFPIVDFEDSYRI
ncbi:restriction endonuclease subunit S, partial [Salmonella enterica subsp. enterica serovar Muenster]|nr:restriction endonuclease subunit S [Salmonella enterica subsp. enterica serovar Muenster]EDB4173329.1 restriction endonuclease subunit S [Salmonella enterica subsp. enterica serovar Muenster]